MKNLNNRMYKWMIDLFPLCRSLTGKGVDQTLDYIKNKIGIKIKIINFKSGKKVYDWVVPKVWNITDGYIQNLQGKKIIQFKKNNLHVVGYSTKINKVISKNELFKHIFTQPNQPKLIPYVTSYYKKNWGFCVSENFKKKLKDKKYKAFINSSHENGNLKIAETLIKGNKKSEIFFSTYFCHPSMANDNLSGVVVQSSLIKYIYQKYKKPNFSYRFIFIPETIGSIAYLSKNLKKLKKNIIAGFNLSCVGDDRCYSHVESRNGNNLADQALESALINKKNKKKYTFLYRGSDERQYCAPGIDLPVCGFSRSKFGEYKEYHTSADNLKIISEKSLNNSLNVLKSIVDAFELSLYPKTNIKGEPQLSKYNLYPTISQKGITKKDNFSKQEFINRCNVIAYSDGRKNIFEISKITNIPLRDLIKEIKILKENKILK
jgi:aminopeptidase-like protein